GDKVCELAGAKHPGCLAFVASNQVLLSGMNTQQLTLWDLKAGKELRRLPRQPYALHPLLSADRKRIVLRGVQGVSVWDAATGDEIGRPRQQLAASFSL